MIKNASSISNINEIILELLRNSLFKIDYSQHILSLCNNEIWPDVFREAAVHNIDPLVLQGVINLPKDIQPEQEFLNRWRTSTFQRVIMNEYLMSEQTEILKSLKESAIESIILKGTGVSCFYPVPELRPLGDIDILINKDECAAAIRIFYEKGYVFDHEHDFHVVLKKNGVILEVHNEVSRYPDNKSGKLLSHTLKNVFMNAEQYKLQHVQFPGPSPFDTALILLLHMQRHLNKGIGLRQLCDWIMFVNANSQRELWDKLLPFLNKAGLKTLATVLTKIGVEFLGLNSQLCPWCLEADNKVCEMLLREIINSGNMGQKRSDEQKAGGYLTDGFENTDGTTYGKIDQLKLIFNNFSRSAKRDFPFTKQYPILLPIICFYIPLRYIFRMLLGKRPEIATSKLFREIGMKKNLYKELKIFQTRP